MLLILSRGAIGRPILKKNPNHPGGELHISRSVFLLLMGIFQFCVRADLVGDFCPLSVGSQWKYEESNSNFIAGLPGFEFALAWTGEITVTIRGKSVVGDTIKYFSTYSDSMYSRTQYLATLP